MSTNIQQCIERQRQLYAKLGKPMMQYLAELHGLSQRQFAEVFRISKAHAEDLIKERVFPSLELAIRIARYWECSTDELFGWRVDDSGERRPLLVEIDGKVERLTEVRGEKRALPLIEELIEGMEGKGEPDSI